MEIQSRIPRIYDVVLTTHTQYKLDYIKKFISPYSKEVFAQNAQAKETLAFTQNTDNYTNKGGNPIQSQIKSESKTAQY